MPPKFRMSKCERQFGARYSYGYLPCWVRRDTDVVLAFPDGWACYVRLATPDSLAAALTAFETARATLLSKTLGMMSSS